jgi:hypothetical protein
MTFDPLAALGQMIDGHGISVVRTEQGILIPESDLVLSAAIIRIQNHPTTTVVQLDVRAKSPRLGDRLLIESFAGWASDESDAASHAFGKFLMSSMHVFLATLIDPKFGADQVEWEAWSFKEQTWQVCLGPVIIQGSPSSTLTCGELLDRLKANLLPHFSAEPHWLRYFFQHDGREVTTAEVLLDNMDWPEGRRILETLSWPEGRYSAREFLLMMPT